MIITVNVWDIMFFISVVYILAIIIFGIWSMYFMFLCCIECGLRIGEAIGTRANQFLFEQGMFVVDGFYKHNQLVRTNYNKCGSEDDKKIRVVPLPHGKGVLLPHGRRTVLLPRGKRTTPMPSSCHL